MLEVQNNTAATVRHANRDPFGTLQTGQAGSITTTLSDPDGASSANTVTVTEVGTTGWYHVAFTPDAEGIWILGVTNPANPDGDGETYEYAVKASRLGAATGQDLTSTELVKRRVGIEVATHDTLIGEIVTEVSRDLQFRMHRWINDATYTEYYDGTGDSKLWLRQGPLVSVTSINYVDYSDGGGGARAETLTEIEAYRYVERNTAAENSDGPSVLELISETYTKGRKNLKVVYTAGYTTLPTGLVGHATTAAAAVFLQREAAGLQTKNVGEWAIDPSSPEVWEVWLDRVTAPWRYDWGVR